MEVRRPFGEATRGTTNPNRLRRLDRWLVSTQAGRLRGPHADGPALVVDLGYGATPVTTLELAARLGRDPWLAGARERDGRWPVEVLGLEIDPERVRYARDAVAETGSPRCPPVRFGLGGFEIPTPAGRPAAVIRAFNVLRQYDEKQVPAAWTAMCSRLAADGIAVDGTCDEVGRRMTWVTLDRSGPRSLTVSVAFGAIATPSDVAERLPKALIHHNVAGEPIHALLQAWDLTWARNGHLSPFGRRQRFVASVRDLRERGWPVIDSLARWRLGEMTVAWEAVAPRR